MQDGRVVLNYESQAVARGCIWRLTSKAVVSSFKKEVFQGITSRYVQQEMRLMGQWNRF